MLQDCTRVTYSYRDRWVALYVVGRVDCGEVDCSARRKCWTLDILWSGDYLCNWFVPFCNVQLIGHSVWPLYCLNYYTVFVGLQPSGYCLFCAANLVLVLLLNWLIIAFCTSSDSATARCSVCSVQWRDLLPSSTICNAMPTARFSVNWWKWSDVFATQIIYYLCCVMLLRCRPAYEGGTL